MASTSLRDHFMVDYAFRFAHNDGSRCVSVAHECYIAIQPDSRNAMAISTKILYSRWIASHPKDARNDSRGQSYSVRNLIFTKKFWIPSLSKRDTSFLETISKWLDEIFRALQLLVEE